VSGDNESLLNDRHKEVDELIEADEIIGEFCRINQEVAERAHPLLRVVIEAAAIDSDVADRLAAQEEYRQRDQAFVLEVLAGRGYLRSDRSHEELTRSLWLAAAPELVVKALDAGWTLDSYTAWLKQVLTALLLNR
jgi:hypothetical protein